MAPEISLETILEAALDRVVARRLAPVVALLEELVGRQPDEWVGVEEAARVLDVEIVTARRMAARGDLGSAKKCGREWRIPRSALRAVTDIEVAELALEARR